MENIFLCKSCQPFGYCRKHYKVVSEKVMAELDQTFYQKVNSDFNVRSKIEANVKAETDFKLVSLEAIRSLYRTNPVQTMLSEVSKDDFINSVMGIAKNQTANIVTADLESLCV